MTSPDPLAVYTEAASKIADTFVFRVGDFISHRNVSSLQADKAAADNALTAAAKALVRQELQALASSDNWRVLLEDRLQHYQGEPKS